MRFLLDTHVLLWLAEDSPRLPAEARRQLLDARNELVFSVASLWEVAIKDALRREDFQVDAASLRRGLLSNGYEELPVLGSHVERLRGLPALHRDPFDRLLAAQAAAEDILLMTADPLLASYPVPIHRI